MKANNISSVYKSHVFKMKLMKIINNEKQSMDAIFNQYDEKCTKANISNQLRQLVASGYVLVTNDGKCKVNSTLFGEPIVFIRPCRQYMLNPAVEYPHKSIDDVVAHCERVYGDMVANAHAYIKIKPKKHGSSAETPEIELYNENGIKRESVEGNQHATIVIFNDNIPYKYPQKLKPMSPRNGSIAGHLTNFAIGAL